MTADDIINILLDKRGIKQSQRLDFLNPDYNQILAHDPYQLTDMKKAVDRLVKAYNDQEKVLIYGDYDSDGITSTAVLLEAFKSFGFKQVDYLIPNRAQDGYGLSQNLLTNLEIKPDLIVTVDCGSLNHAEIDFANSQNIDVIVTDHHNIADQQPSAIAVVNPKRNAIKNGFSYMAGVGVAFTLVRALQTRLSGLKAGQEKWLLDLVALGTITDMMELRDDNRILVHYGLKVMRQTRRIGLKMMLNDNKVNLSSVDANTLGFILGPRFNAAGRVDSANLAVDLLLSKNPIVVQEKVKKLEYLNQKRRALQDKIYAQAVKMAEESTDSVLILVGENWHEGVVGIVAARIMDEFAKPTFVLRKNGDELKGSARSFGDFSISEAIQSAKNTIISGGGHDGAGGVKLESEKLTIFKNKVNQYYESLKLKNQLAYLLPKPDVELVNFELLTLDFYQKIDQLAPFGVGNPEPIFEIKNLLVEKMRFMGQDKQHLKVTFKDENLKMIDFLLFNKAQEQNIQIGDRVDVVFKLTLNSWQGRKNIEGLILQLNKVEN